MTLSQTMASESWKHGNFTLVKELLALASRAASSAVRDAATNMMTQMIIELSTPAVLPHTRMSPSAIRIGSSGVELFRSAIMPRGGPCGGCPWAEDEST